MKGLGITNTYYSLLLLLLLSLLSLILIANSDTGTPSIAVTGSFYKYEYVLSPNTSIESRDIYIAIFNTANKRINVSLGYEAPKFIEITFSKKTVTIEPGGYRKIYIRIRALPTAIPGSYEVKVYANIVMKTVEGKVVLIPGAGQKAIVRILGSVGRLLAETIDKNGKHVVANIEVLRISRSGEYTYVTNTTGYINASLPPGQYIVRATLAGETLNETKILIEENKTKIVKLVVSTVWFDYFDALPYYKNKSMVFAEIIGVIKNVYKPLENISIILVVKYNGVFLENVTIANTPILPQGRTEYKYRYIPVNGWRNGTYEFKLIMRSGSTVYAETPIKRVEAIVYKPRELTITETRNATYTTFINKTEIMSTSITSTQRPSKTENYTWLLAIIIVVVVLALALAYYIKQRKA